MKEFWDFIKPLLIKAIRYFITILLTALGFSSLQSCAYVKDNSIENAYFTPRLQVVDSSYVSPEIHIRGQDSTIVSYDEEASTILNNATSFLKILSNKFLNK